MESLSRYDSSKNVGLPSRFTLAYTGVDNLGNPVKGFLLVGGEKKAEDSVNMMVSFIGWFRIYKQDFVPDVLWMLQKPTSILHTFKTLILGKLLRAFDKHVPFIRVEKINVVYDLRDRKQLGIVLQYYYKLTPTHKLRLIRFVSA